ncbi:MAG: putative dual-specificity RNA methyltransferase RlmN [Dehalococcoidia bacterium]|nr:putative dual-specificity RNA methyltransferase RlmN [Chloroflexota bacterium]
MPKIAITELSPKDLTDALSDWGEPRYRARQILDWVYHKPISDFSAMSNLPPNLRERLDSEFSFQSVLPVTEVTSRDGTTTKVLFRLSDGRSIESVLMMYDKRRTVCVSSQVGCAFGCPLCATGASGFERNLTPAEITDQALFFSRRLISQQSAVSSPGRDEGLLTIDYRPSNVVFMGMGEPLVNFEAVWRAVENLISPNLLGLGARHITISTIGIPSAIKKLSQKKLQVGLAVSLHAPNNELRDLLAPPNRMYPLEVLIPACRSYVEATRRRITFEYTLIRSVNDSVPLAIELADLLRGLNCHVDLIPVNPAACPEFKPPHRARVQAFHETLTRHHVPNTIRLRRGLDIHAGCGQLRAQVRKTD